MKGFLWKSLVLLLVTYDIKGVNAASQTGSNLASVYNIKSPDIGSCRLKGIDKSADNFKFYASLSGNDVTIDQGCGRCIKVSCSDSDNCQKGSSIIAYVLDVCQGCTAGSVRLSSAAFGSNGIGAKANANSVSVSYSFVNCPADFLSGNIKACMMEGASASYIPLQFYNSQRVITKAVINGMNATENKDSFYFSSNPQINGTANSDWYKNIQVTLSAGDDVSKSGVFSFSGTTGCSESSMQFSVSSTAADADNGGVTGAEGHGVGFGVIIGAVVGAAAVILVIIGSIWYMKRRRSVENNIHDLEGQDLSPKPKTAVYANTPSLTPSIPAVAPPPSDTSSNNESSQTTIPQDVEVRSPTVDYNAISTPVAPKTVLAASPVSSVLSVEEPPYSFSTASSISFCSNFSDMRPSQPSIGPATESKPNPSGFERAYQSEVGPKASVLSKYDRSSFDVDDMRADMSLNQSSDYNGRTTYDIAVTSPQSYMEARSGSHDSYGSMARPSYYGISDVSISSDFSHNRGSVARPSNYAVSETSGSDLARSRPSVSALQGESSPPDSSARDNNGYRRNSLNILEYPYARRYTRNGGNTETEF